MDEQEVVVQNEVEETTPVDSPQTEVETTVPQTNVEAALPDTTEEQRKAFQEQRLEIKRLREEVEARKQNESAFNAFKPKPQLTSFSSDQFVDPVTGEINIQALTAAQEANITSKVTRQFEERLEQEKDENTARSKYPELFSDPDTEQEIADRWIASKLRGENASVTEIAARVNKRFQSALTKAEQSGAEKALQDIAPKERVALTAQGQSSSQAARIQDSEKDQAIRESVRFGSDDALAEAMSQIPWANK